LSGISIRWDQRSLDGLAEKLKRFPGIWLAFLEDAGKISADRMRENAPVRTGALWSSIIIDVGPKSVSIHPTVPYAPFVEAGTRPHIIRPVNASVLHFFSGGKEIFAKEVHHPGFQGRFFIRKTRDEVKGEIADLARLYVMNLFEE
jgi:hypothetical protein